MGEQVLQILRDMPLVVLLFIALIALLICVLAHYRGR